MGAGYSDEHLKFATEVLREVWERSELAIPSSVLGRLILRRDSPVDQAVEALK
jgi:hypothetical protein